MCRYKQAETILEASRCDADKLHFTTIHLIKVDV